MFDVEILRIILRFASQVFVFWAKTKTGVGGGTEAQKIADELMDDLDEYVYDSDMEDEFPGMEGM